MLLFIVLLLLWLYPPARQVPAARWGEWLEGQGVSGWLLLFGGGVLATSLGAPRQLLAFIAGIAYGTLPAVLLSVMAATLGCTLTVLVSRRFLAERIQERYPQKIEQLQRLLRRDLIMKILILRLQPLGTNMLTNVCAGVARIPLAPFLLASAVGYVPQMVVFALLGAGVRVGSEVRMMVSGVLLLLALLLAAILYRRHLTRKALS